MLRIKDQTTGRLAAEVAAMTGESLTEAIRVSLSERKARLRGEKLLRFLEEEVWPYIPPALLGKKLTRRERARILGYGPGGA
jgi:antitoxin VapB